MRGINGVILAMLVGRIGEKGEANSSCLFLHISYISYVGTRLGIALRSYLFSNIHNLLDTKERKKERKKETTHHILAIWGKSWARNCVT